MITSVLALALLPATLLASPRVREFQDVIGFEEGTKDTLATANVTIYNNLPVDIYTYLIHWRGEDSSTKKTLEWDWEIPKETTYPATVQFNTARKEWDRWQAGIKFRNPSWSFWTKEFYFSPNVDDPRLLAFVVGYAGIGIRLGDRKKSESFTLKGADWPKDAVGINAYFFLKVQNNFDSQALVDVNLETRSPTWKQNQKFNQKKGEISKPPLPFFFENNATKEYAEQFAISVSSSEGKLGFARKLKCEMDDTDAGEALTLKINSTGCSISNWNRVICDGKWQTPKSGMSSGDEVEL